MRGKRNPSSRRNLAETGSVWGQLGMSWRKWSEAPESESWGILNLCKNTASVRTTPSGTACIPDFRGPATRTIIELMNTSYVNFTAQTKEMAGWAANNGHRVELWLRQGASVTGKSQHWANQGFIGIQTLTRP